MGGGRKKGGGGAQIPPSATSISYLSCAFACVTLPGANCRWHMLMPGGRTPASLKALREIMVWVKHFILTK